jgi:hypothetical protein
VARPGGDHFLSGAVGGLTCKGGSSTSITIVMGVLRCVYLRSMRGVVWRASGHVVLWEEVIILATLGGDTAATLGGPVISSLCCGLLQRTTVSFRMVLMCFCLSAAVVGKNWRNDVRRSVALLTGLLYSETLGSV